MINTALPRFRSLALGALLALSALPASAPAPVRAEAYNNNYSNFLGEELMRLTNIDRVSLGKPALKADRFLVELARDKAVTCPSNSALTVRGRARDMSDRDYFGHAISGCTNKDGSPFKVFDMVAKLGYSGWTLMGENLGTSTWGVDPVAYKFGCDINGANCKGETPAVVPQTIANMERSFMKSSTHRSVILGSYTRFGCAAWTEPYSPTSLTKKKYTCLFAAGTPPSRYLDTAGPSFSNVSGAGTIYSVESTVTFRATATDALSRLSDGNVTLDGKSNLLTGAVSGQQLKRWAYDHTGKSASLSVTLNTAGLARGAHTLTWKVRDTATNARSTTITFYVGTGPVLTTRTTRCGTTKARRGPSTRYAVVRTIAAGTRVKISGKVTGGSYAYTCPKAGRSTTWAKVYWVGSSYYPTPLYVPVVKLK